MNDEKQLFEFLSQGVSSCHVTEKAEEFLKEKGFAPLEMKNVWKLSYGGKYYVKHYDSTLAAFTIGEEKEAWRQFRIAAAHTDFPCFKIKPNPETAKKGYGELNTEPYGGGIWNTWLDRPLSVAGRVALKSDSVFAPREKYVDFRRPLLTIPNLAIHMNREVNKGVELNKQTELLPILTGLGEKEKEEKFFRKLLAKELSEKEENILEYELTVYCAEEPSFLGMNEEFISSPRLDNITSVYALVRGIAGKNRKNGSNLIALFDHEEIGSRSKQGAASLLLRDILERIAYSFGAEKDEAQAALYNSIMLSADVAHGMHPNYEGKTDPTNQPILNRGFCIKEASSQSYATDCRAIAMLEQLCQKENIPYQKFVNRSDQTGGGTLGAIASALLPIPTIDMGVPLLAMHSARELMGKYDMEAFNRCIEAYFTIN